MMHTIQFLQMKGSDFNMTDAQLAKLIKEGASEEELMFRRDILAMLLDQSTEPAANNSSGKQQPQDENDQAREVYKLLCFDFPQVSTDQLIVLKEAIHKELFASEQQEQQQHLKWKAVLQNANFPSFLPTDKLLDNFHDEISSLSQSAGQPQDIHPNVQAMLQQQIQDDEDQEMFSSSSSLSSSSSSSSFVDHVSPAAVTTTTTTTTTGTTSKDKEFAELSAMMHVRLVLNILECESMDALRILFSEYSIPNSDADPGSPTDATEDEKHFLESSGKGIETVDESIEDDSAIPEEIENLDDDDEEWESLEEPSALDGNTSSGFGFGWDLEHDEVDLPPNYNHLVDQSYTGEDIVTLVCQIAHFMNRKPRSMLTIVQPTRWQQLDMTSDVLAITRKLIDVADVLSRVSATLLYGNDEQNQSSSSSSSSSSMKTESPSHLGTCIENAVNNLSMDDSKDVQTLANQLNEMGTDLIAMIPDYFFLLRDHMCAFPEVIPDVLPVVSTHLHLDELQTELDMLSVVIPLELKIGVSLYSSVCMAIIDALKKDRRAVSYAVCTSTWQLVLQYIQLFAGFLKISIAAGETQAQQALIGIVLYLIVKVPKDETNVLISTLCTKTTLWSDVLTLWGQSGGMDPLMMDVVVEGCCRHMKLLDQGYCDGTGLIVACMNNDTVGQKLLFELLLWNLSNDKEGQLIVRTRQKRQEREEKKKRRQQQKKQKKQGDNETQVQQDDNETQVQQDDNDSNSEGGNDKPVVPTMDEWMSIVVDKVQSCADIGPLELDELIWMFEWISVVLDDGMPKGLFKELNSRVMRLCKLQNVVRQAVQIVQAEDDEEQRVEHHNDEEKPESSSLNPEEIEKRNTVKARKNRLVRLRDLLKGLQGESGKKD
eukprot:TRINITY_DN3108_c0_g1_i19.p1 TRINITY_DN3108_c0_g1~~TRINITY_DN3108_c0_g1_i19.p1  ORF type:complete len:882 (-),score=314.57 TRINITY_DN3108_c0_g1_i19:72-2717(-)